MNNKDYSCFQTQGGQSRGLPDWVHGLYEPVIGHTGKENRS